MSHSYCGFSFLISVIDKFSDFSINKFGTLFALAYVKRANTLVILISGSKQC